MTYGVLPYEEAESLWEEICERKGKPAVVVKHETKKNPTQRKRKQRTDDDVVGDTGWLRLRLFSHLQPSMLGLESGSTFEGVGTTGA